MPPAPRRAPTRTARLGEQKFGYRSIGTGRPVVFVMGLSGTIDAWPPSFLDAVAAKGHRVLVFDNEGAGRSTLRPGTLTIRRMGQDTARFIRVLHLRRPDVVGWSMGGMIAQSFAIKPPEAAAQAGPDGDRARDGKGTLPDAAALNALANGDEVALLNGLFPSRPDRHA
jgi:pimeloyl-ACP methyl ester carboxylesterase